MNEQLILCVDDNASCLRLLQTLFEIHGFRVLCASSGQDGLALFASQPVNLVVLDYEMPKLKGDVVALLMKVLKPGVPVMMYSSLPDLVAPPVVDAVVEKGGRTDSLLAQVSNLLERSGSSPAA